MHPDCYFTAPKEPIGTTRSRNKVKDHTSFPDIETWVYDAVSSLQGIALYKSTFTCLLTDALNQRSAKIQRSATYDLERMVDTVSEHISLGLESNTTSTGIALSQKISTASHKCKRLLIQCKWLSIHGIFWLCVVLTREDNRTIRRQTSLRSVKSRTRQLAKNVWVKMWSK